MDISEICLQSYAFFVILNHRMHVFCDSTYHDCAFYNLA